MINFEKFCGSAKSIGLHTNVRLSSPWERGEDREVQGDVAGMQRHGRNLVRRVNGPQRKKKEKKRLGGGSSVCSKSKCQGKIPDTDCGIDGICLLRAFPSFPFFSVVSSPGMGNNESNDHRPLRPTASTMSVQNVARLPHSDNGTVSRLSSPTRAI